MNLLMSDRGAHSTYFNTSQSSNDINLPLIKCINTTESVLLYDILCCLNHERIFGSI